MSVKRAFEVAEFLDDKGFIVVVDLDKEEMWVYGDANKSKSATIKFKEFNEWNDFDIYISMVNTFWKEESEHVEDRIVRRLGELEFKLNECHNIWVKHSELGMKKSAMYFYGKCDRIKEEIEFLKELKSIGYC